MASLSRQVPAGLAGFFDRFALALAGFLWAGAMLTGLPTGLAAATGSGSGLKCARHPGDSRALFWIMHAVMRSTSGMKAPQSDIASPVQACCCSGV